MFIAVTGHITAYFYVERRSENGKTIPHIPSVLARRALRHEFETAPLTVASDWKDSGEHVANNVTKPTVRETQRLSVCRKRQPNRRRSLVHRQKRPSVLSRDRTVSASCDNDEVGIRTRRMSAVDATNDQNSTNLMSSDDVNDDKSSRLSIASTAPATGTANIPTEIAGLFFCASIF